MQAKAKQRAATLRAAKAGLLEAVRSVAIPPAGRAATASPAVPTPVTATAASSPAAQQQTTPRPTQTTTAAGASRDPASNGSTDSDGGFWMPRGDVRERGWPRNGTSDVSSAAAVVSTAASSSSDDSHGVRAAQRRRLAAKGIPIPANAEPAFPPKNPRTKRRVDRSAESDEPLVRYLLLLLHVSKKNSIVCTSAYLTYVAVWQMSPAIAFDGINGICQTCF